MYGAQIPTATSPVVFGTEPVRDHRDSCVRDGRLDAVSSGKPDDTSAYNRDPHHDAKPEIYGGAVDFLPDYKSLTSAVVNQGIST